MEKPDEKRVKRILFVCLGNICRSPAAEGVFQALIDRHGLQERVTVDSAGTSSFHIGEPADKRMRAAARNRGLELRSRSRMVSRRDFEEFDMVIAMDRRNYRELHQVDDGSGSKIKMLSDYLAADEGWPDEVPDPYYGGDQGFEHVLDMLEAACPRLLNEVLGS